MPAVLPAVGAEDVLKGGVVLQAELLLRFVLDYDRQEIHDGDRLMAECRTDRIETGGQATREAARQLYRLEGGWRTCVWCITWPNEVLA